MAGAIETLYGDFYGELLRHCLIMTGGDMAGAEDLCQEAYMRALRHLDEFEDLGSGQQKAWLRKVARNCWIDSIRKRSRESYPGEEALELASFEEDFTKDEVGQLVNSLPTEERALFAMRYLEGYNATELGEIFGLPPGTVRSRLSSARKRLQKMLKEYKF